MKHEWEYKKLSEACDVLYGCPFDSAQFTDDSKYMPLIRIRDIKNSSTETFYKGTYSQEYVIKKGDFLIGMDGEFNVCEWKGVDALLNQRVCKVYSKNPETLDRRFLYWSLPLQLKQIEDLTPFVTVKHLSAKKIADIKIPNIPFDKQINIANELDSLSKIIADCKETLKDYDALEQSIFYDMFGDPVKNEKGWEVKKLGDICIKITDGTHDTPERLTEGVKFITGKHIRPGVIDYDNSDYVDEDTHKEIYSRCNPEYGDVLYTNIGANLANAAVNTVSYEFSMKNVALFKPQKNILDGVYLQFFLNDYKIKDRIIENYANGGAQSFLSLKALKTLPIVLPPLPLQQQFASKIEAIEQMKSETKKALQEAETLFNARMDYWFN